MKAMDCVSGQPQVVPFADGFAMGFNFTSRTPLANGTPKRRSIAFRRTTQMLQRTSHSAAGWL
eukprot:15101743-Alexandrium_andersonii.AAC.1